VVLSQGHVDPVDVTFENGKLKILYHDETVEPGVERNPLTVLSVVKSQARTQVPDDPAFAFLGAPGADVWVLPEVQNPDLLFPGLSTEDLTPGVFGNDAVTVRFKAILGPNGVSLFTTGAGGEPHILVDSEDGLPDSVVLPVGTHAHANWAFEAPGTYFIVVDATATLAATGQHVTSDPTVLTFTVKP
jgi:surface-anchored protein